MRKKKTTKITVETHQTLVIRQRQSVVRTWCEKCAAPVRAVTVEEAAAAAGMDSRAIHRRVKGGRLHITQTPDGVLLICSNSLRS